MASAHIEHDNGSLAKALVAFQSDLPKVALDSVNPHFKSKFTSLGELTSKVFPVLAKHGLAYTATSRVTEGNGMVVLAKLIHESGEEVTAEFPIVDTNPQKIGSALSYARRYLLASLTGVVADTDDDGNAASVPSQAEQAVAKARTVPAKSATASKAQAKIKADFIDTGKVPKEEVNDLVKKARAAGHTGDAAFDEVLKELEARA